MPSTATITLAVTMSFLAIGVAGAAQTTEGPKAPVAPQAAASQATATQATATQPTTAAKAPSSLALYFDSGSAAIRPADTATLDQASRLYRDGHPIVMVVSGASDLSGSPQGNLLLSQARANAVVRGLVARGIPVDHFQVLAKGETDPTVPTPPGVADPRNRRVDITWR